MPLISLKCDCGITVADASTYADVPAKCPTCDKQVQVAAGDRTKPLTWKKDK